MDSGFVLWWDLNGVNLYFNKIFDSMMFILYLNEIIFEIFNQLVVFEEVGFNFLYVLNSQFLNFVENVVECLGERGFKFVLVELVKYLIIKDVWVNVIV